MDSENRRSAIRRYGRGQATGFFLGALSLALFFLVAGLARNWLHTTLGETVFTWVSGVMMFASFLIPPMLFQFRAVKDELLYCPHCNNFLGGIRAAVRLNKHSDCNHCSGKIDISPINKRHARYDIAYILSLIHI